MAITQYMARASANGQPVIHPTGTITVVNRDSDIKFGANTEFAIARVPDGAVITAIRVGGAVNNAATNVLLGLYNTTNATASGFTDDDNLFRAATSPLGTAGAPLDANLKLPYAVSTDDESPLYVSIHLAATQTGQSGIVTLTTTVTYVTEFLDRS